MGRTKIVTAVSAPARVRRGLGQLGLSREAPEHRRPAGAHAVIYSANCRRSTPVALSFPRVICKRAVLSYPFDDPRRDGGPAG